MSVCPNCGLQQPDGAAFCDDCGAALDKIMPVAVPLVPPAAAPARPVPAGGTAKCPTCGAPVTPGKTFCDSCGAALGQAASAPQYPGPTAAPEPAGALVCSNCNAPLEPGSIFCDMCGTPVSPVQEPPPSPDLQPGYPPPPAAPQPGYGAYPPPGPQPGYPPPPAGPQPGYGAYPPPEPQPGYPPPQAGPQSGYVPPGGYQPGYPMQGRLVVQGTNATLPFPPGKTEAIVGREDPVSGVFPEIDMTDHGGDEGGVSRRHARILVQGTQIFIEDLNSTNYTYVNQQRLVPGQPHPLNNGDEVRFGRIKLNFYAA